DANHANTTRLTTRSADSRARTPCRRSLATHSIAAAATATTVHSVKSSARRCPARGARLPSSRSIAGLPTRLRRDAANRRASRLRARTGVPAVQTQLVNAPSAPLPVVGGQVEGRGPGGLAQRWYLDPQRTGGGRWQGKVDDHTPSIDPVRDQRRRGVPARRDDPLAPAVARPHPPRPRVLAVVRPALDAQQVEGCPL